MWSLLLLLPLRRRGAVGLVDALASSRSRSSCSSLFAEEQRRRALSSFLLERSSTSKCSFSQSSKCDFSPQQQKRWRRRRGRRFPTTTTTTTTTTRTRTTTTARTTPTFSFLARGRSFGSEKNDDDAQNRFEYSSENTDPVVNESFITPDFGYRRQYQVGHDILNTGEPLAASVTTITSAATSSFANAIYRLEVTTGACRGAGTSGRVNVILIGQDGITYPIDLEYTAGDAPGFARGSTLPFRVAVAAHLGPIRRARVRLLPDSTSTGRGWFLEDIGVKCEKTNESYKFTCRDWFGPSDADDTVSPYNRDLEVTTVKNDFEVALEREQRTKMRREMGDFVFDVGAATIPHQDKIKEGARAKMSKSFGYGGEDAYFIETKRDDANDSNELSLGVADGVYMWRWEGVDAGLYSRALLREAAKTFMSATKVPDGSISADDAASLSSSSDSVSSSSETPKSTSDPSFMLERAFHAVTEKNVKGSTTCVLLTLDSRLGVLNAANIGDSGYLVARLSSGASSSLSSSSSSSDGIAAGLHSSNNNENGAAEKVQRFIAYRSPPQEHDFGRPFQLGHHEATDTPTDAMLSTFFLENDDVIVVGTDGLWDNVSEKEILSIIENRIKSSSSSSASTSSSSLGSNHAFSNKKEVDACAKELTQKAFEHANDRSRTTPYSLAATEHFDMVYSGGKKDDITVLVCKVKNRYRL